MRSMTFLTTLSLLVLVSACADQPSGPAPLPPNVNVPAVSRADVLALLENANEVQVPVTQNDLEQMAQDGLGHNGLNSLSDALDSIKLEVDHCNTNDYVLKYSDDPGVSANEQSECYQLGHDLAPLLANNGGSNVDLTAAEVAFARACVAPKANGIPTSGCVDLGQLYEFEGKPELALAVYQNAEKCQGTLVAQSDVLAIDPDEQGDWSNLQRKDCLKQEVAILAKMRLYDAERKVATTLCDAASVMGCGYLKTLGADVDIQAVAQRQAELQAANEATAAADETADAKARVEHDANFAAKMQALQNAAGNDPNAIVDTANQAAARMNALGAANDAALQQTAEQRREQATAQQREAQANSAANSGFGSNSVNSGAASTGEDDHKLDYKVTYTEPAMNCLVYTAPGPYEGAGVWVTNSCSYEIMITSATPSAPASGMTYLDAGDKIFLEEKPVKVFACKVIKRNDKDALANMGINKPFDPALNRWVLPTYDDPNFVCPLYLEAP